MVWFDDRYLSFEIIIVDWEFHQHGICTVLFTTRWKAKKNYDKKQINVYNIIISKSYLHNNVCQK